MTLFDYTVMAIILVSIAFGVIRGLVREVLSLIAWIAAFIIANRYAGVVGPALPDALHGERLRLYVAFGVLFVGTLLVAGLIGWAIGLILRTTGLQLIDRALGGVFGLARGVLIVLTGVLLLRTTSLPQQPVWREAVLAPLADAGVAFVRPYLPETWSRYLRV